MGRFKLIITGDCHSSEPPFFQNFFRSLLLRFFLTQNLGLIRPPLHSSKVVAEELTFLYLNFWSVTFEPVILKIPNFVCGKFYSTDDLFTEVFLNILLFKVVQE